MNPFILQDLGIDLASLTALLALLGGGYKLFKEIREDRAKSRDTALQISQKLEKLEEIHTIAVANRSGNKNLHRYLLQTNIKIALARGYTTSNEIDEISVLFESYVSLGGNGSTKALYERFLLLPPKEEGYGANAK